MIGKKYEVIADSDAFLKGAIVEVYELPDKEKSWAYFKLIKGSFHPDCDFCHSENCFNVPKGVQYSAENFDNLKAI